MADNSLKKRFIVVGILVPLVVLFTFLGGWPFTLFVALTLGLAVWEFWRMFRCADYSPSLALMAVFTLLAVWLRHQYQFQYSDLWLTVLILLSMSVAVLQQMRAQPNAAFNFAITISGALYLGWLGSFAVSLRALPNGLVWTLIVLFAASIGDGGAYLFGSLWGKHKIAPALSPKKSWEGYFGGVLVSSLTTWLLTLVCHFYVPQVLPVHGLILGCVLAVLTPMGDFAESMLKRQFNLKDTSHILPGHGGIMDRIDSSLWAIAIGFYIIQLFF
jgi:phosphatidate cytidylyltransferase